MEGKLDEAILKHLKIKNIATTKKLEEEMEKYSKSLFEHNFEPFINVKLNYELLMPGKVIETTNANPVNVGIFTWNLNAELKMR